MSRLGEDLLSQERSAASKGCRRASKTERIKSGRIEGIGSVSSVEIGFYNYKTKNYESSVVEEHMEVTSLMGNIALKDSKPYANLHIHLGM
jgi:predicted DNA-binding protein with PD1-like motif